MVDGELDWREWTDREQKRREAVVLRARQILFEHTGSTAPAENVLGEGSGSPDGESGARGGATSPAGPDDVPF